MNEQNLQDTNSIMTANPTTLAPDETVSDAVRKMYEAHYRSMPVVDADGSFIGLFSIYRLIEILLPKAVLARHGALDDLSFVHPKLDQLVEKLQDFGKLPVVDVLEKKKRLTVCKPSTSLTEMLWLLHEGHSSLPVVIVKGKKMRLVGIVSYWDVLSKVATRLFPGETESTSGEELAPQSSGNPAE